MKLENKKLKIGILLIAALMVTTGIFVIWMNVGPKNAGLAEGNQEFSLVRPAFAQSMAAQTTLLSQEAGMAIWLNATANAPLNLNAAKSVMQPVENATSDYVVGSIPLQSVGFTSDDNPHCFVDVSGWIVVYYLKVNINANPSTTGWLGKMFPLYKDSNHVWYDKDTHQLNDNLLHYALGVVCQALSVNPSGAQYYHFQYPSATTLEIAIKTAPGAGKATFNINIPGSFIIDEQSWSYYSYGGGDFKIDSTSIVHGGEGGRAYGDIPSNPNPLSSDVWHEVYLDETVTNGWGYTTGAIIVLYH